MKTLGSSLMISGFICACHGFMKLGEKKSYCLFKAGKNRDGWFTNDDLITQIKDNMELFEHFHPPNECELLFAFDNSMSHHKRAPDGLDASLIPLKDGGKNCPLMRSTKFTDVNGQIIQQNMLLADGTPKGMKTILTERGLWLQDMPLQCFACKDKIKHEERAEKVGTNKKYTPRISTSQCCASYCLANQPDFLAQREWLREVIEDRGHKVIYYPKYHCEFNSIETVWCYSKVYTRKHCSYDFNELCTLVPQVLDDIPIVFIRRTFRHCFRFMSGYREGLEGPLLDYAMKIYTSHRRIPANILQEIKTSYEKSKQKDRNKK
jgi:hypothetical protein